MIYLFFGEDSFGIESEVTKIEDSADWEVLKLKEQSFKDFSNAALSASFFSEKRLLVLRNFLSSLKTEKEATALDDVLKKIDKNTTIIFIEEKELKGKIALLLKNTATVKSFSKPSTKSISDFIRKRFKEEEMNISPLAVERLAGFVGADFYQLDEEIKKLSLYKRDEGKEAEIQVSDVDELVKSNFEANIFELLDAIAERKTQKGLKLLNSFLDSGENEIYILTMIARQFRNIAIAKFESNITEASLAKKAGIHPFVAKKSVRQALNLTEEEILRIYGLLTEIDFELKSGHNPKQALSRLIV